MNLPFTEPELRKMMAENDAFRRAAVKDINSHRGFRPWLPNEGPQTDAYWSKADMLLYGGAAGGGKSDLVLGYAVNEAERALMFRRQFVDMTALSDRLLEIVGAAGEQKQRGWNDAKKRYVKGKLMIEFGHLEKPRSELGWQGRAHDFIGVDEAAQIDPKKLQFVFGWLRSTTGKRCRIILASNPPLGGEGDYLITWFAPWLDPMFNEPALPGELRWCITDSDGNPIWVPGPGKYTIDDSEVLLDAQSRTFIPAKLDDNPYLAGTGYEAQINSMPEPLRTALRTGNFLAGRQDHEWQVIPTEWILAAFRRYEEHFAHGGKLPDMLNMGVDVAQGGPDRCVFAPWHDHVLGPLIVHPGKKAKNGPILAGLIMVDRRNDSGVTIDMGGGWGGSAKDFLSTHHYVNAIPYVGAKGSHARAKHSGLKFNNLRAEAVWRFREALDPSGPSVIMMHPDPELQAELTTYRWKPDTSTIKLESKEDLVARIGRSPDKADSTIMGHYGKRRAAMQKANRSSLLGRRIKGARADDTDDYDPLADA